MYRKPKDNKHSIKIHICYMIGNRNAFLTGN